MYLRHVIDSRPIRTKETVSENKTTESTVRDAMDHSTPAALSTPTGSITPPTPRLPTPPPQLPTPPLPPPPPSDISVGITEPYRGPIPTKSVSRTDRWNRESIVPVALKIHYSSSDTSSEPDHTPLRQPRGLPRACFPDNDMRAWQSYGPPDGWYDSDHTVEDEIPLIIRFPRPSSKATTASTSTASTPSLISSQTGSDRTHGPRKPELCRRFLQNRCGYGDSCRWTHASASGELRTEVLVSTNKQMISVNLSLMSGETN